MSDDELRAEVAAELERMSVSGGDLDPYSSRSTWRMYGDRRSRLAVWQELSEEFLSRQTGVVRGGRIAVITAGAPGAGKTTGISRLLGDDLGSYRRIDPDVIKDQLLIRATKDGIYEHLLRRTLPDGLPLFARELSGLVHEESVQLAGRIRRMCMRRGENVIVEGTLSWPTMIDTHLGEVTAHGYDAVDVIYVSVDLAEAEERALARWWRERNEPDSLMGGRFVPQAAIRNCWIVETGASKCRYNAQELHRRASRQEGLQARLTELDSNTWDDANATPTLRAIQTPSTDTGETA